MSAKRLIPVLIRHFQPKSIVDVGCGRGMFLKVAQEYGIKDVLGVDGPWAEDSVYPGVPFIATNLRLPIRLARTFDLALCLEVGEHLPKEDSPTLVRSLTTLSPVIAFSAAIPFQGGTHHVNEQWPSYWERLFRMESYIPWDYIRWEVWEDKSIDPRYRQNIICFVVKSLIAKLPVREFPSQVYSVVHPEVYADYGALAEVFMRFIPSSIRRAAKKMLRRKIYDTIT